MCPRSEEEIDFEQYSSGYSSAEVSPPDVWAKRFQAADVDGSMRRVSGTCSRVGSSFSVGPREKQKLLWSQKAEGSRWLLLSEVGSVLQTPEPGPWAPDEP